ncbi:MAG: C40 family peptidase [Candidatus Vogelbacteria bacterium]|nr:C40 family peptidase [Candidatus Vogelbacteria bacterium]
MKVSYNWLQSYFKDKLPAPENVAELLTNHSFEIESIEPLTFASGSDSLIDVKVLPNRAHDCLSHLGVAREVGILTGLEVEAELVIPTKPLPRVSVGKTVRGLNIEIEENKLCKRYVGRMIEGVEVKESPEWLKERLISVGQRPINNIVDAANFVMLHMGQPLHAFDADKMHMGDKAPSIFIRRAEEGDIMKTLDNKDAKLSEEDLVIADGESILAIAGVKGGIKAAVDENTKNIVLESANFAPTGIRRTSQRIGIRTDASHRFENEIDASLAGDAMEIFVKLVLLTAKTDRTKVSEIVDRYARPRKVFVSGFSTRDIYKVLGEKIDESTIEALLNRLGLKWKKVNTLEHVLGLGPKQVGKPHNETAQISYDAPESFDCSSLTAWLYSESGVAIPRMTIDQYFFGTPVDIKDILPGDLVFSNTHDGGDVKYYSVEWMKGLKVKEGIDHVGLYLGQGKILHSSRHTNDKAVIVEKLKDSDLFKDIVGVRRIVDKEDERYRVEIPLLRLDLRRMEDLVEEIGRLYGYEKIVATPPTEVVKASATNKLKRFANSITDILVGAGYSEVYLYSYTDKGHFELANPLAPEKAYMRDNLRDGLMRAVSENLKYQDDVKIFEIGKVFLPDSEKLHMALAFSSKRKFKQGEQLSELKGVLELLERTLRYQFIVSEDLKIMTAGIEVGNLDLDGIIEIDLEALLTIEPARVSYNQIGRFPSIIRDIAILVPEHTSVGDVQSLILANSGSLVQSSWLFDTFSKEGKKSLGFRIVFQSKERTLSDSEVNLIMEKVSAAVTAKGWSVR